MSRPIRALVALLAVTLLAVPASASASKKAPRFDLTITGSQVSTWNQSHFPEFACDATVTGAGSQQIPFAVKKTRVALFQPKGLPAVLAEVADQGAQYGVPAPITTNITAEREGYQNIQAPGGECNGTGGWDGVQLANDCGQRYGTLSFTLGYSSNTGAVVNQNTRDILRLAGQYAGFEASPFPAADGEPIGHTFENCPYWPAGFASGLDELITTGEKLPAAKLAKVKVGKSVKLSGGEVEPGAAGGDFTGETTIAWNLTLKRVK